MIYNNNNFEAGFNRSMQWNKLKTEIFDGI